MPETTRKSQQNDKKQEKSERDAAARGENNNI
jgi:hypothetical protein